MFLKVAEYTHPCFQVGGKNLDRICVKTKTPKEPKQSTDSSMSNSIHVYREQIADLKQQVKQLQELSSQVSRTNRLLTDKVLTLRRTHNTQKQAHYAVWRYLSLDKGAK